MAQVLDPREKYEFEQLLGLAGTYDKKSLKKAYIKQVQEWHPDHAQVKGHDVEAATKRMTKINDAFVQLSGLLDTASSTVDCSPKPTGGAAASAGATTASTGAAGSSARSSAAAAAGEAARGYTTYTERTTYSDHDPRAAAQASAKTKRNMDAARRYTRIVTDPRYVRWFVTGIGPHIVWAIVSFIALTLLLSAFMFAYGAFSPLLAAECLPWAIAYDLVTGKGAELVGSMADVWAVNKAVKGLK